MHSGSGIELAGEDDTAPSLALHRIDIHDNLLTDIDGPAQSGADISAVNSATAGASTY